MTGRKPLIAGGVVLVVVVLVGAFLLWPRGSDPVTKDEAVEDFRSQNSSTTTANGDDAGASTTTAASTARSRPEPGVYTFAATGSEDVKLGPFPAEHRELPTEVSMVLVHDEDPECFTTTAKLFEQHSDDTTLCASPDGTVRFVEHRKHQQVGGMSPTVTFKCDPNVVIAPSTDQGDIACAISLEGAPVKVESQMTGSAKSSPATVEIAGQAVAATLVELTFNVSGSLSGTWVEKLWLANDTQLPVQMERELDLSGPATLKESNKLVLTDLTPTT
ncbi:MAG: hypothetical protein KDB50_09970 [Mycobacterium sp.]|nr:hypothetical protein [Mycobacterium sp.]